MEIFVIEHVEKKEFISSSVRTDLTNGRHLKYTQDPMHAFSSRAQHTAETMRKNIMMDHTDGSLNDKLILSKFVVEARRA
jgi:hypothetical protein